MTLTHIHTHTYIPHTHTYTHTHTRTHTHTLIHTCKYENLKVVVVTHCVEMCYMVDCEPSVFLAHMLAG